MYPITFWLYPVVAIDIWYVLLGASIMDICPFMIEYSHEGM